MKRQHRNDALRRRAWLFMLAGLACGCGTMRVSDTTRTANEQMLISHSIDDTVSHLDFRLLAGKRVFLDTQYLEGVTDKGYLISSLRQQLLACGCLLQEERKRASYVVEARAGSVGTDRNDMLVGVPQMMVPSVMPGVPGGMIPEIALAKKTNRRAVAKLAVFAYDRTTGDRVWQSGVIEAVCREQNHWLFGTGPFQRGTMIRGTAFDDQRIVVPLLDKQQREPNFSVVAVTQPAIWKSGPLPDSTDVASKTPQGAKEKVSHEAEKNSTSEASEKSD